MALETATYIASLNPAWPDGGDQRSTADDHARLTKAVLKRTLPLLDGAVSLSSAQLMYLGDLSASVQLQLNQLRDGTATAANAINSRYANSASLAVNATMLGGLSLSYVATLSSTNVYSVLSQWGTPGAGQVRMQPGSSSNPGYVEFLTPDGTRRGYIGWAVSGNKVTITSDNAWGWDFQGATAPTIGGNAILHAGSSLLASSLTGSVPNASITLASVQQYQSSLSVASASTATLAATATNALSLDGLSADAASTGSTIAARNPSGHIFVVHLNTSALLEPAMAVGAVIAFNNTPGDNYLRRTSLSNFGSQLSAQNITGRSGTSKTLASGSGPPSLSGSTNGDLFFYY